MKRWSDEAWEAALPTYEKILRHPFVGALAAGTLPAERFRFYIRQDGLLASYHPDFIVCTADHIYIVETKGNDKLHDANVQQKRVAATEWCRKTNTLPPSDRMERCWEYVLLGETVFYSLAANGATFGEICKLNRVSSSAARGELF